jgi:large subunit ribosomal protein L21
VLLISDKEFKLGTPLVEKSVVEANIVQQTKAEKINGFKYKAKSRYRRRYGHRQNLTEVKILKIK